MIGVRVAAWIARRACRCWLTAPLRAADAWMVWRSGEWALYAVRTRPNPRRTV